jgi:hypothetical protein
MRNKDLKVQPHAAGKPSTSKDLMVAGEKPPEYEPDGGPLDEDQLRAVRETAAERLPQGRLMSKASLFD